jgi:hypothetical protein
VSAREMAGWAKSGCLAVREIAPSMMDIDSVRVDKVGNYKQDKQVKGTIRRYEASDGIGSE